MSNNNHNNFVVDGHLIVGEENEANEKDSSSTAIPAATSAASTVSDVTNGSTSLSSSPALAIAATMSSKKLKTAGDVHSFGPRSETASTKATTDTNTKFADLNFDPTTEERNPSTKDSEDDDNHNEDDDDDDDDNDDDVYNDDVDFNFDFLDNETTEQSRRESEHYARYLTAFRGENQYNNDYADEGYYYFEEEEDDDDDDENSDIEDFENIDCDCEDCKQERLEAIVAASGGTLNEGNTGIETEIEDIYPGNNDQSDDDDSSIHSSATATSTSSQNCAICFMPKKNLVTLPCCGAKESESSTRFCRACMHKQLSRSANSQRIRLREEEEKDNEEEDCTHNWVGECPRCRALLSTNDDDGQANKTRNRTKARKLTVASIHQKIKYIEDKGVSGMCAKGMLLTIAYAEPNFLPYELIMESKKEGLEGVKRGRLLQWGLISSLPSTSTNKLQDIDTIDAQDQICLRQHIESHLFPYNLDWTGHPPDSCQSSEAKSRCQAAFDHFDAALEAAANRRPHRTLRLANRGVFLFLRSRDYLVADFTSWWHGPLVLILHTGFLAVAIVVLLSLALVVLMGWLAVKAVGFVLRRSEIVEYTTLACTVLFLAGYINSVVIAWKVSENTPHGSGGLGETEATILEL